MTGIKWVLMLRKIKLSKYNSMLKWTVITLMVFIQL
jgi:hypothetical protein